MTLLPALKGALYRQIATKRPWKIGRKDFWKSVTDQIKANSQLMTLIEVDRQTNPEGMINVFDQLDVDNEMRFSLAPMAPQNQQEVAKLGA